MISRSRYLWNSRFFDRHVGRVVVADPDEAAFSMVRQLTAPDRWQVMYASSAEELRSILHTGPVSLAVVDLAMLDGSPRLAAELADRSRRGLRVVVTTDEHNESNERRARMHGPVFYAPKPLNIRLLNHVVEGALGAAV